jgi:AraC-like DNA-binding protein
VSQDPALIRRLLRAKDAIDSAFDEHWPIARLARVSGVSAAHFARSFKQAFGLPPHRYLLTRRIERAAALLRDTDRPIIDIAFETGWRSLGTFGRIFRDIIGASPGEIRERDKATPPTSALVPECFARAALRPDLRTAVSEKRRESSAGTKDSEPKRRSHEPRHRSRRSVRSRSGRGARVLR